MTFWTGVTIYWILAAFPTGYILNKQNQRISLDGVIGNTPAFNAIIAGFGGGLYLPLYGIIKLIRWVLSLFN